MSINLHVQSNKQDRERRRQSIGGWRDVIHYSLSDIYINFSYVQNVMIWKRVVVVVVIVVVVVMVVVVMVVVVIVLTATE